MASSRDSALLLTFAFLLDMFTMGLPLSNNARTASFRQKVYDRSKGVSRVSEKYRVSPVRWQPLVSGSSKWWVLGESTMRGSQG